MSKQPTSDAAKHPLIGQSIGKYHITRLIGSGGMGAVFEANHESLNQRVAIKVLHARLTADPPAVQRFMNEAHTTSVVHHVGLVRVFDYGQLPNGIAYIMMEYLEGESLRDRLKAVKKLALPDALRITRQIAAALAAAHEKGVVHRDLKPENVLLVPDSETASGERAKVLDFGIAKIMEPDDATGEPVLRTTTGAIMGTPTYMSPEQCRGTGRLVAKTDVYSLGVMLYQMLSGRPTFVGTGSGDLIAMHIMEKPQQLRELEPSISPDVETLVHNMLAKKTEERPSMKEVLVELEQLGLSSTGSGYQQPVIIVPPPPPARPSVRMWLAMAGVGLLLLLVGGGIAIWLLRNPAPTGRGVSARPRPVPPLAPPPAPTEVTLTVATEPSEAQVLSARDLKPLGKTPWQKVRPHGQGPLELVVRAPGFFDEKLRFTGQGDETRRIKMVPVPPATASVPPADSKKNGSVKKPIVKTAGNSKGQTQKTGDKPPDDILDVPVVR